MNSKLQPFDPDAHLNERWPATLWIQAALECELLSGGTASLPLLVPVATAPGYITAVMGFDGSGGALPPNYGVVALAEGVNKQAAPWLDALPPHQPVQFRLFDGYHYDPATHIRRTMQQDLADAGRLFPTASPAPGESVSV